MRLTAILGRPEPQAQITSGEREHMAGAPAASISFLNYETDAAAHLFETLGPTTCPYVTGDDGTTTAFTVLGSADLAATDAGQLGRLDLASARVPTWS